MLRVYLLLPPRKSAVARSRTRTLAPASRADRAAQSAAFPPPATSTSTHWNRSSPLSVNLSTPRHRSRLERGRTTPSRAVSSVFDHLLAKRERPSAEVDEGVGFVRARSL